MKLLDKVAIVTGASRGLGKAIALAFAREGARVVVASRTEAQTGPLPGTIYQTAQEIEALGGKALAVKTDVSSEEEVEGMVRRTVEELGRVDILVNNAGIDYFIPVADFPVKRWDLIVKVNLKGPFLCCKAVLPLMMKQRAGNIINICSTASRGPHPLQVPYSVTKAGLEMFTRGLALEVKEHNIAVNALCPHYTDTDGLRYWHPKIDYSRLQTAEMWARYAVFLAAQDARGLTGRSFTEEEFLQEGIDLR